MNIKSLFVAFIFVITVIIIFFSLFKRSDLQNNKPEPLKNLSEKVKETPVGDLTVKDSDEIDNINKELEIKEEEENKDTSKTNTEEVTELKIEDIKVGTGREAKKGDFISVHYVGTLLDGTKFDSSRDRGTPFIFQVGAGQVIKGWDVGVIGMKEGGIRKLTIPANMAYGSKKVGNIPANSPLVFEIELLSVAPPKPSSN